MALVAALGQGSVISDFIRIDDLSGRCGHAAVKDGPQFCPVGQQAGVQAILAFPIGIGAADLLINLNLADRGDRNPVPRAGKAHGRRCIARRETLHAVAAAHVRDQLGGAGSHAHPDVLLLHAAVKQDHIPVSGPFLVKPAGCGTSASAPGNS